MRLLASLCGLAMLAWGSGCVVAGAAIASAAAITATTVKTAGKVTTATVSTGGKVTAAAVRSSGDAAALSLESASRLARAGMVVLVDGGSGAIVELPWRDGLRLQQAVRAENLPAVFKAATIFRTGRVINARLNPSRAGSGGPALRPGDVVELLR